MEKTSGKNVGIMSLLETTGKRKTVEILIAGEEITGKKLQQEKRVKMKGEELWDFN